MGAQGLRGEAHRLPRLPLSRGAHRAPCHFLEGQESSPSPPGPGPPMGHPGPRAWGFTEATSSQPAGTRTWLGVEAHSQLWTVAAIASVVFGTQWQEVRLALGAGHPGLSHVWQDIGQVHAGPPC